MVRYEPVLAATFDWPLLLKLNQHVFRAAFLNHLIDVISNQPILTGCLLVGLLWYLWFESNCEAAKAELLLGLGAAIAAGILNRGLQLVLPTPSAAARPRAWVHRAAGNRHRDTERMELVPE
jgi:hypothetical protein